MTCGEKIQFKKIRVRRSEKEESKTTKIEACKKAIAEKKKGWKKVKKKSRLKRVLYQQKSYYKRKD